MAKYAFSNVIGSFLFDEHMHILIQKDSKEEIIKAAKRVDEIDNATRKRILEVFRSPEYLSQFYQKNVLLSRRDVQKAINADFLVIQCINAVSETGKILSTMTKRMREWYELYNPELSRKIRDHEKLINIIIEDTEKRRPQSLGAELKPEDLKPIIELAKKIKAMYSLKNTEEAYLESLMAKYCPNITAIAGSQIGAQLLAQAGSLKHLAELPSSTIQVLGAEEAFFRHLITGSKSPKYGYIHEHPLVLKAERKARGKVARIVADKLAIAAKVDYFKGKFVGNELRMQIEKKAMAR